MDQPYHARLQLLMIKWIKENGGEFGAALQQRGKNSTGIQVGPNSMLGVDCVAMHMATAAAAVFEAMADATDNLPS